MISLEYFSGFFDADGYVGVVFHKTQNWYSLRITLTNTNKLALQKIQSEYGGSLQNKGNDGNPNHKEWYHLCWFGKEALILLKLILPYTIVKHSQVELALTFPMGRDCKELQESIYKQLKELKHNVQFI